MTDSRPGNGVPSILRLLAETLERLVEGDESALGDLSRQLEDGALAEEGMLAAAMVLRQLAVATGPGAVAVEDAPGGRAMRVPSAEELESLSPEAWGYLIGLRGRGSLSAVQFERVLEMLLSCGVRPVDLELARETAARVALEIMDLDGGDLPGGENLIAN